MGVTFFCINMGVLVGIVHSIVIYHLFRFVEGMLDILLHVRARQRSDHMACHTTSTPFYFPQSLHPNCTSLLPLEFLHYHPIEYARGPLWFLTIVLTASPTMALPNGHGASLSPEAAERQRRRLVHHEADVLIIGAGILGCALAVALGKQGRSVLLLENSMKEPDRIVGELMQPGGVQALEQLGLGYCLEDIDAIRVDGYRVSYFGDPVNLQYPRESPNSPQPEGRTFHHGRLVMKLRSAVLGCPNVTVVEAKATDLITCSHTNQILGVECIDKESGTADCYFAHLTVVADGYASKFRKGHHPYTAKARSKFWGLELIDAKLPSPCYGHVFISDAPPILIYQIGTRETRILVDIPDSLPSASVKNGGVKGHLRNVVLPILPDTVQGPFLSALESGQLRSMPNSFLPASKNRTPGLMILGDALNMRHPLTGGGMTVALNDVVTLRQLLSPENVPNLGDTTKVLNQLSAFHWERKKSASVINILAQADRKSVV